MAGWPVDILKLQAFSEKLLKNATIILAHLLSYKMITLVPQCTSFLQVQKIMKEWLFREARRAQQREASNSLIKTLGISFRLIKITSKVTVQRGARLPTIISRTLVKIKPQSLKCLIRYSMWHLTSTLTQSIQL